MSLASIRDLPTPTRIRTVSEILEASVIGLARVLNLSTERMPSGLIWYRDPTSAGQEERYRQVLSLAAGAMEGDPGTADRPHFPAGSPAAGPSTKF
jgi:hypothetical protein